jgi:hypothetical protein
MVSNLRHDIPNSIFGEAIHLKCYKAMMSIKNNRFITILFSMKTASFAMLLLAVLTVWGTFYEMRFGLYEGRERFFRSWVVFAWGVVPLPGIRPVAGLLFVQCAAAMIRRFKLRWQEAGFLLLHAGILLFFLSMGIIAYTSVEASLTLGQGEQTAFAAGQNGEVPLPVRLTLLEFKKTDYAGTSMAKSYESRVRIEANGLRREAIISMNRPLRLGSYTFYQQSYAQDGDTYSSTFAVVKNPARNLPAVAGVVIAVGFLLHFMFKLITSMARARRAEQPHVV